MNLQNRHFLSIKEVSNLIGISVSTINREVEKGTFPPKHKLSAQRVGFLKYEIDQWIEGERGNWLQFTLEYDYSINFTFISSLYPF